MRGEAMEPRTRRLLEAVERALKLAHMIWTGGVEEAGGLLAVDVLLEPAVEEGVLDVQLVDRPAAGDGEGEDGADGRRFHDGTEGFPVVHAFLLSESSKDPARLVPCEGTVGVELVPEDPFACNNIHTRWTRYQSPSVILNQSVKLVKHCVVPVRIFEGRFVGGRDGRDNRGGRFGVEIKEPSRLAETRFCTGVHLV